MDSAPLVLAFSDSAAVRETLSVLLEADCRLDFVGLDGLTDRTLTPADLALVAVRHPARLIEHLTRRRPELPVLAIRSSTSASSEPARVPTVTLDPHVIRSAVLQRLPRGPEAEFRAAVRRLADTLHTELAYPFAALRSLCPRPSDDADAYCKLMFATILREQAVLLERLLNETDRFRARPRAVIGAPRFAAALCLALAQPDELTAERGLLCRCVIEPDATATAGPVAIAPLIAALMRFHLQRCSAPPFAEARATAAGMVLRYTARKLPNTSTSWPLLLAALALLPSTWHLACSAKDGVQTLRVRSG